MMPFISLASAHADATPHVHSPSFAGLLVLAAWIAAAVTLWRKRAG